MPVAGGCVARAAVESSEHSRWHFFGSLRTVLTRLANDLNVIAVTASRYATRRDPPSGYDTPSAQRRILLVGGSSQTRAALQLGTAATSYVAAFVDPELPRVQRVLTGCEVDVVLIEVDDDPDAITAVLQCVRHTECKAPIYVLTSFDEASLRGLQTAAELGLDFELLRKPLPVSDLTALLAEALGDLA